MLLLRKRKGEQAITGLDGCYMSALLTAVMLAVAPFKYDLSRC